MEELIIKIFHRIGFFQLFNVKWRKTINGKKFRIPIIKEIGLANLFMSEPWMLELLEELLMLKRGAFIDIGVNLGQTLLKLKSINPEVEYVGFEPNPSCVFYVKELTKESNIKNSTLIPVGIFNQNHILELVSFHQDDTDSASSLIRDFRPLHKIYDKQYVPVFTFETIERKLDCKNISIIKIDVEGAELEVLESIEATIARHRSILLLELLPVYSVENRARMERQAKVEDIIARLKYTLFRVLKTEKEAYGGLREVNSAGIHSDLKQCDYVVMPNELKDKVSMKWREVVRSYDSTNSGFGSSKIMRLKRWSRK